MVERKYSISDLEALRMAVENKWLFGVYNLQAYTNITTSRSYMADEKTKAVEEMVRTHMLAGHTAEELYASEQQEQKA